MSDSTIQQLFVNLERTIHDRLNVIQEVMQSTRPLQPAYTGNTNYAPCQDTSMLLQKIYTLEATVQQMNTDMTFLREKIEKNDILPLRPIDGIEVVPKREVVLEEEKPLSFADRLLLNKKARKALEAEEMGEAYKEPMDVVEDEVEEAEEAEEAEVEEEAEEAEEPEEEEAEEEAEELEDFEYKGSTYYRDSENNVFMTDENGELVDEPIGKWNSEKQRIVMVRT